MLKGVSLGDQGLGATNMVEKNLLFFSVSSEIPFNDLKLTCIFYCDKGKGGERKGTNKPKDNEAFS